MKDFSVKREGRILFFPKKGGVKKKKFTIRKNINKQLNFFSIFPNLITLFSLCCGITGIRFAFQGKFSYALIAVFFCAVLDGIDGKVARMLHATSKIGVQLDSFADLICFGICPAFVMYFFSLSLFFKFGWCISLFYIICMTLRLARFNVDEIDGVKSNYSKGVPAPAGALLALSPLINYLAFQVNLFKNPYYCSFIVTISCLLMISKIPTFVFKKITVHHSMMIPVIVSIFVVIAFLYTSPWKTMSLAALVYALTVPVSFLKEKKEKSKQ